MTVARPVVFLDMDGVLVTSRSIETMHDATRIDPECVAALNRITDATGADLVLSSSWRHAYSLHEMRCILRTAGVTAELIDVTPRLEPAPRWFEMHRWLDAHPERAVVVAIDDFPRHEAGSDRVPLVQCRMRDGLTMRLAERAIRLLSRARVPS